MEVQKHPHHVTHKKKWSEYLLEFLMIFLAVFLGFLAENFREHSVDLRKEKEYMRSLVQDLNADVESINENLEMGSKVSEKLDSFIYIMNEEDVSKHVQDFYRLGFLSGKIIAASFNNRTSSQLKNSGSMRLVRNMNLSDSIRSYWSEVENDEAVATNMQDQMKKSGDIAIHIYYNKYLGPIVRSDAKLFDADPKLIVPLANSANVRRSMLIHYLKELQSTKEEALRLIDLIKKEYQFE